MRRKVRLDRGRCKSIVLDGQDWRCSCNVYRGRTWLNIIHNNWLEEYQRMGPTLMWVCWCWCGPPHITSSSPITIIKNQKSNFCGLFNEHYIKYRRPRFPAGPFNPHMSSPTAARFLEGMLTHLSLLLIKPASLFWRVTNKYMHAINGDSISILCRTNMNRYRHVIFSNSIYSSWFV